MISLGAKSYLFHEGDPPTSAFLIEDGSVEIVLERPDGEVVVAVRMAGEMVGEMAIVDQSPRSASVRAREDSVLIPITDVQIAARMAAADPVLRMVLGVILDRFRSTMADISGRESPMSSSSTFGNDPALAAAAFADLKIERDLERAIAEGEIILHYQPVVSLLTGRVVGFESLARWHHPERGMMPPSTFIPIAEVSGLSAELACVGMRQIGRDMPVITAAALANPGNVEPPYINLNVSGRDLGSIGFMEKLAETSADAGIDRGQVNLELTETAVVRSLGDATSALLAARNWGYGIAIDDFGTGYASLNYIRTMKADALKIDRSFVQNLKDETTSRFIVASILQLAVSLDLSVIAEGVETVGEATTLRAMGCTYAQGYLFGRPQPLVKILELISIWNAASIVSMMDDPGPAAVLAIAPAS